MFKLRNRIAIAALLGVTTGCATGEVRESGSDEPPIEPGVVSAPLAGGLHPLGWIRDSSQTMAAHRLNVPAPGALPAKIDMSAAFPPVGDQGTQGSCVGWATGYATKTEEEVVEEGWSQTNPRYQYSPSWVYNQINGGVDQGAYISDALLLLVTSGADTLEYFPYDQNNFTAQPNAASYARAQRFASDAWHSLAVNATTFKQVLNGGDPVIIGFEVLPDFDNLSAANPTYDSSTGNSRGGHAVALIGYDDAKSAFQFQNSWGTSWGVSGRGWIAYSFITDAKLALEAYTIEDDYNAEPPVHDSLYAVAGRNLRRIDNDFGDEKIISTSDWTGATSLATLGNSVYVIQSNRLHKVDPATGSYTVLGGSNTWSGSTRMVALGTSLYIIQNSRLYKVNPSTGAYTQVGTADWTGATSMTALNNSLYIIQNSRLQKVNPSTGAYTVLGGAAWGGTTYMTGLGSALYVVQNSRIHSVNASTGAFTQLGSAVWASTTSLATIAGKLYAIRDNRLVEVKTSDGSVTNLANATLGGPTVMAGLI